MQSLVEEGPGGYIMAEFGHWLKPSTDVEALGDLGLNKILIAVFLALITAFSIVPSFAASSFTASVTCKGPKFGIIGGSSGYWNWTLNGVPIGPFMQSGIITASGAISCNSTGGGPNTTTVTGTQPSNANGIIATATAQIHGCYHKFSASQSFTAGQRVFITVKASCTANAYGGTSVTESGTFTLKS